MKKLLLKLGVSLAILGTMASTGHAQGYHGPRYSHHHHHSNSPADWVIPAIIGGVIVYGATRTPDVHPNQFPVYEQKPPVIVPKYQYAMPGQDGTIWREEWRYIQYCNCYRQFLIQVQ